MSTDDVIAAVRDEWHAAELYACNLCGRPSVDGKPHRACLADVRAAVQETMTAKELAVVVGVTPGETVVSKLELLLATALAVVLLALLALCWPPRRVKS